jgi:formylglycine-generating enzyme required for sulfatase activity
MKTFLTTASIVLFSITGLVANNVTLSNISLEGQSITTHSINVVFDISWDNSWRTATTVPANWDACWVFAKYRITGGEWHHCTLSANGGDYSAPSGSTITPATDGKGAYVYRSQDGSGTNTWADVAFKWNYGTNGVNDDAEVEVKLFAIEMVYIPQGNFYTGDGNGTDESLYALHVTENVSFQLTSSLTGNVKVDNSSSYDDATLKSGIGIDGDGGLDTDNNGTVDNAFFPTGYQALYIMKYEISQDQYKEFLNTLTRTQQQSRIASDISGTSVTNYYVLTNNTMVQDAQSIRCLGTIPEAPAPVEFFCDNDGDGIEETCDGLTLVCNYLKWTDLCAYADWAGLRPMSELEYEKATRGPNYPVYGEYAWGNTNLATAHLSLTNFACPNSERRQVPDEHTGRALYNDTYTPLGTLTRCGELASSSVNHTRQEAGAGYYGMMEMSGSQSEPVVSLGNVAGRSYRANNGNGELNTAGEADVDYWPGINGNFLSWQPSGIYGGTTGVTGNAGSGNRGGHIFYLATSMRISDRYLSSNEYGSGRYATTGGRMVRNAP